MIVFLLDINDYIIVYINDCNVLYNINDCNVLYNINDFNVLYNINDCNVLYNINDCIFSGINDGSNGALAISVINFLLWQFWKT